MKIMIYFTLSFLLFLSLMLTAEDGVFSKRRGGISLTGEKSSFIGLAARFLEFVAPS